MQHLAIIPQKGETKRDRKGYEQGFYYIIEDAPFVADMLNKNFSGVTVKLLKV